MSGHIVVATDFSPAAGAALEWGALVGMAQDAQLHLLHVVRPLPPPGGKFQMPADLGAELLAAAQERLEQLAAPQREAGLNVRCQALSGRPWSVVLEEAERLDAGLLVVGTRSHPAATRFPLGSTAARILQKAGRPVLAVHPEDQDPVRLPRRVLLATDLSEAAWHAAQRAVELFLLPPGEACLLLLHVWAEATDMAPYERIGRSFFAAYREQSLAEARRALEEGAESLRARGFEAETLLREGRPAEEVVDCSAERAVGLIAMSTRGRRGLDRALWGSVAHHVVQHAPCPVLTVPAP